MRASTPSDQLQYMGDCVELPRPKLPIGTRVRWSARSHPDNPRYYAQQVVRQLLRDTRKVVDGLRREGYSLGKPGSWLPAFNKGQIRTILDMMRCAESVEIAGHAPDSMHCSSGTLANQCYLRNGQCHSGVYFRVYLLFRRTVNGNKVVYLYPHALVREDCLEAEEAHATDRAGQ